MARVTKFDPAALESIEKRFYRDQWEAVPRAVAEEHGMRLADFGPVQVTIADDLAMVGMDFVLGTTAPGATGDDLEAAIDFARTHVVSAVVPVTPGAATTEEVERRLTKIGCERLGKAVKYARDDHPPRFPAPQGVEVTEVGAGDQAPFGQIVAAGEPAWTASIFAALPGLAGWHCYLALLDGEAMGAAEMLVDGEIAHLGLASTLESARRKGCQTALLRRRIEDARGLGASLLSVDVEEDEPGESSSSRSNLRSAGFEPIYERNVWVDQGLPAS
jgi:GNAT superfamily N-acetyltransferase